MYGHIEPTGYAPTVLGFRGESAAALEIEQLVARLGLIDLPMSLHLLQLPRAGAWEARAFVRALAGRTGQRFEVAPSVFVLLFIGSEDGGDALEGRIARHLGAPAGRSAGAVAALRSLECRSHDVVRGEWLMAELRARSPRLVRAAA